LRSGRADRDGGDGQVTADDTDRSNTTERGSEADQGGCDVKGVGGGTSSGNDTVGRMVGNRGGGDARDASDTVREKPTTQLGGGCCGDRGEGERERCRGDVVAVVAVSP